MPIFPGDSAAALAQAADRLAQGGLVAFPTETVYGLGARADDDAAVAGIFAAKGRPSEHPLIVHVSDIEAAKPFARELSPMAQRLMAAFWPGPMTVIVARTPGLAGAAAGGQDTIGLRCPAHPVAQALLRAAQSRGVLGVAGPSANRFGRVSATQAAHVVHEFGPELWVLDGGECPVGIESAIVDCSRGKPALLRPGSLTQADIEAALGEPLHAPDAQAPRASGTLASHYAPRAKVRLMQAPMLRQALDVLGPGAAQVKLAVYSRSLAQAPKGVLFRPMPATAEAVAHELFTALRALDDQGAQLIWIEEPPTDPEWEGVRDRLQRAAA